MSTVGVTSAHAPNHLPSINLIESTTFLRELINKVSNVIFSKFGAGLLALNIVAGACFGTSVAIATFFVLSASIGIYTYNKLIPESFEQLLNKAIRNKNAAEFQSLVNDWNFSFCYKKVIVLQNCFNVAKEIGEKEIAIQILRKILEIDPENEFFQKLCQNAPSLNDKTLIEILIAVLGPKLTLTWIVDSFLTASRLGNSDLIDFLVKNPLLRQNSLSSSTTIIKNFVKVAQNEQIKEKIIKAFLPLWPNFWNCKNSNDYDFFMKLFADACFVGNVDLAQTMLSYMKPSDPTPTDMHLWLKVALSHEMPLIVKCLLETNRLDQNIISSFNAAKSPEVRDTIKAYSSREILDTTDIALAALNTLSLTFYLFGIISLPSLIPFISSFCSIQININSFEDLKISLILSIPFLQEVFRFFPYGSELIKINNLYIIGKHSFRKIQECCNTTQHSPTRRVAAIFVHAFNFGSSLMDAFSIFKKSPANTDANSEQLNEENINGNNSSLNELSSSLPSNLDPKYKKLFNILNDPTFDPKNIFDAKRVLTSDKKSFLCLTADECLAYCNNLKKEHRRFSLLLQQDINPDMSADSMLKLDIARDTINSFWRCSET